MQPKLLRHSERGMYLQVQSKSLKTFEKQLTHAHIQMNYL